MLGGPGAAKGDRGESDLENKKVLVDTSIYTKDNVPFKKNFKIIQFVCLHGLSFKGGIKLTIVIAS